MRIFLAYGDDSSATLVGRVKAGLERREHRVFIGEGETNCGDDCLTAKFSTQAGVVVLNSLVPCVPDSAPAQLTDRSDLLSLADVVHDCLDVFLRHDTSISRSVACFFERLVTVALDSEIPIDRRHALAITLNRVAYRNAPGRLLRILVVEDSLVNQKLLLALLQKRGHRVEVANNGREGVMAVEAGFFDVILMNIEMPEMDGVEATKAIRALPDPEKSKLPIIAATAHSERELIQRFLRGGMDDYLQYPVRHLELFAVVEAVAIWDAARARGEIPSETRCAGPERA